MAYLIGQPALTGRGWTAAGTQILRDAVHDALRGGSVTFHGSQFHIEEAAGIPDEVHRRRFMEAFWELVSWNVLLPTHELVIEEVRHRRPLVGSEPFEEYWTRQQLRRISRSMQDVDRLAIEVRSFVGKWVADSSARRLLMTEKLQALFTGLTVADVSRRWWANADAEIDDWLSDYISSNHEHLGLGDDQDTWPTPLDLQTARAIHAYMMARIVMNVGLGRRIGDGDAHDAQHYATACYADVFVTEDGALRDTLDIIPSNPVTVLSFTELAAQFGVRPM